MPVSREMVLRWLVMGKKSGPDGAGNAAGGIDGGAADDKRKGDVAAMVRNPGTVWEATARPGKSQLYSGFS